MIDPCSFRRISLDTTVIALLDSLAEAVASCVVRSLMTQLPPLRASHEPTPAAEVLNERLLLRETEAARLLAVTPRTLQAWRVRGGGPRFVRLGGRAVRYSAADLAAFVEHGVRRSTSDPGTRPSEGGGSRMLGHASRRRDQLRGGEPNP